MTDPGPDTVYARPGPTHMQQVTLGTQAGRGGGGLHQTVQLAPTKFALN